MSKMKFQIELFFERIGYGICRNRIKTLLLMLLLIFSLVAQVPKLTIDTSFEGMLHADDPKRIEYNAFRDQFGQDRIVLCTVETRDVFDKKFLTKLKALHEELQKGVPHLDEVNSLVNARRTEGEGDTLIVEDLLEDWPSAEIDLAEMKQYALNNPVYLNDYVTADARVAAIIIKPIAAVDQGDGGDGLEDFADDIAETIPVEKKERDVKRHYLSKKENKEVVEAVYQIIDKYRAPDFRIALAGGPVSEEVYDSTTKTTMRLFTKLSALIILLALYLLFRRVSGAVYPLIIVYLALASTLGVMALAGVSISVFSVVLPSFLMAVGIADSVHIYAIFLRRLQAGAAKVDAIAYALRHSGLAVLMTSLTTAAGLLSFSMSELSSIGHLGIFAAIGVTLALIYTVILLPAFLSLTPIKVKEVVQPGLQRKIMDRVLIAIADFSSGNPIKIVVGCALMTAVAVFFMLDLRFSHNHKNIFPETMTIRKDEDFIDKVLNGMLSVEIVLDTQKENGLYDPVVLKKLDEISQELVKIRNGNVFVGKVRSMNDILKETNQALHKNNPVFYSIPDDRALIAQELLLFENSGSDDLEKLVDSQFSKTRVSIKIPYMEVIHIDELAKDIYSRFQAKFQTLADITLTGMSPMMGSTVAAAIRSMTKSYVVAFFVITILMILLVGDYRLGLLSMIPNLFPILFVMGFMGAFNVLIDLNALMICSIAIGLVVDDTMHFMYNYRKYYEITGDSVQAVRETLLSTGRAMLITSIVLTANFFLFLFATFTSTHKFGFYTGFVIIMALLADFLLAPALMILVMPHLKLKGLGFSEKQAMMPAR